MSTKTFLLHVSSQPNVLVFPTKLALFYFQSYLLLISLPNLMTFDTPWPLQQTERLYSLQIQVRMLKNFPIRSYVLRDTINFRIKYDYKNMFNLYRHKMLSTAVQLYTEVFQKLWGFSFWGRQDFTHILDSLGNLWKFILICIEILRVT